MDPEEISPPSESETTLQPEILLATLIHEGLKRKGITLQKLSDVSGIALKHLENMSGGNMEKMPPAPYLRSYLAIIGDILEFDGHAIWETIKIDELSIAGKNDQLSHPTHASRRKKIVWTSIIVCLLGLFLVFRLPDIIGRPNLQVGFPSEDVSTVSINPITIIGTVENGDEFFINDERIPLASDGTWQKEIELQEGMNTIELRAKKFLGKEVRVLRQIIYAPGEIKEVKRTTSTTTLEKTSSTQSTSSEEGPEGL